MCPCPERWLWGVGTVRSGTVVLVRSDLENTPDRRWCWIRGGGNAERGSDFAEIGRMRGGRNIQDASPTIHRLSETMKKTRTGRVLRHGVHSPLLFINFALIFLFSHFTLKCIEIKIPIDLKPINAQSEKFMFQSSYFTMTSAASGTMRPCFAEEEDGLASIGDFSGHRDRRPFICRAGRRGGVGVSSASAAQQHCSEAPHFLQACFLCKKPLAVNCDTFMYRGDVAFCSEECRKEEIEADEAREKRLFVRSKRRNSASAQKQKPTANAASSPAAAAATVAAA